MNNNDIILINETHLENIDKIIVILNEKNKIDIPRDIIIKQAENIIFDYLRKGNFNSKKSKNTKILCISSICFIFGISLILATKFLF